MEDGEQTVLRTTLLRIVPLNRASIALVLLTSLGIAACGDEAGMGNGANATREALRDINERAALIHKGLTPLPCGTDAITAMNGLTGLIYDHLHRSDWPMNASAGGPYPLDRVERQAAAAAVCKLLSMLQAAVGCEDEEVRHNAIATLAWIISGGPSGPYDANKPPEWASVRRVFLADLDQYAAWTSHQDPIVADGAMEVVIFAAPRSPVAWELARKNLRGEGRISPDRAAAIIGMTYLYRGHFTPLLLEAVLDDPPEEVDDRVTVIEAFEVQPSAELAERMRSVLAESNHVLKRAVLQAVATPICAEFLEPVLAVLKEDDGWSAIDAARAVKAMGRATKEAARALEAALAQDEPVLKQVALDALIGLRVSSPPAVEAILQELETRDRPSLLERVDALGACGVGVPRAVSALKHLTKDPDPEIAKRATAALAEVRR